MSAMRIGARLAAVAAACVLALAGCASSSIQTDAAAFINEHGITATRAAAATKAVETDLAGLSNPPSSAQLDRLSAAVSTARRQTVRASEWDLAKSGEGGEEGAEEEDLPRAETEATAAANELANAMSALQSYARAPSVAKLARYRSAFAHAREVWNESISQLWYLAHESSPPVV